MSSITFTTQAENLYTELENSKDDKGNYKIDLSQDKILDLDKVYLRPDDLYKNSDNEKITQLSKALEKIVLNYKQPSIFSKAIAWLTSKEKYKQITNTESHLDCIKHYLKIQ